MIARALEAMGRHAPRLLAAGVLVALFVPWLTPYFRPLLVPALIFPMVIALMRIDWGEMIAHAKRPWVVALFAVWCLILCPLGMAVAAPLIGASPPIEAALVLMAAAPPIISSAAIALMLGLDAPFAVVAIVATTALVPVTLPPIALGLLGIEVDIGLGTLMLRLAAIIGGAFAIALLVRRIVPTEALRRQAPRLDGLSVISLWIFALAIMDGVNAALMERPAFVIGVTLLSFVANLALQAASALAFAWAGRRLALTIGLLGGNCNMGLVLTALADRAELDTVVYFAMAQFPMYVLPAIIQPIYRRLLRLS